ncbi:hypothetical protein ALMP_67850 [Streptomyces sp. A012304]|nr:hypothetical protein ALMP_67850 [Streptomyces sp. A012304]
MSQHDSVLCRENELLADLLAAAPKHLILFMPYARLRPPCSHTALFKMTASDRAGSDQRTGQAVSGGVPGREASDA